MDAAAALLTDRDAYALWIAGAMVIGMTVFQMARASGPKVQFRLPRPTRAHLGTLLAWLIIAVSVAYAISRLH